MANAIPAAVSANEVIHEASLDLYKKAQAKGFPYYLIAQVTYQNGTTKKFDGINYHFRKDIEPTIASVHFYAKECFNLLFIPAGYDKKPIDAKDLEGAFPIENLTFYKENDSAFLFAALNYSAPDDLANEVGKCQIIVANSCKKDDWKEKAKWLLSAQERINEPFFKNENNKILSVIERTEALLRR